MLNKKICFITGGSRGIGRTIVNSFLENNAIVVFTYLEMKILLMICSKK